MKGFVSIDTMACGRWVRSSRTNVKERKRRKKRMFDEVNENGLFLSMEAGTVCQSITNAIHYCLDNDKNIIH